jgi:hypothetical protein
MPQEVWWMVLGGVIVLAIEGIALGAVAWFRT